MAKKVLQPELSVVVTAHREGIIAHKTILSVFRALKPFDHAHIPYEIIVHIDSGDEPTLAYFERYKNDARFTIYENPFRNPAESRNFAILHATGKYTTILDGDDLISRDWLIDSYRLIVKHEGPVIMRPNYQVQFGGGDPHHNIWIMEDSFSKSEDALIMSHYNRWPNVVFANTKLLQSLPFKPTLNGFGYEDWLFNCDVRAAEIPNIVVPDATLFYRRRANSVTSEHAGTVLPYSDLFDIEYMKSLDLPPSDYRPESMVSKLKRGSKKAIFDAIKQVPALHKLATPAAQKILYKKQSSRLPQGLLNAWKDINSIDNELWPTIETVVGVRFHPLSFNQHNVAYGTIYKQLADQVSKKPDYLFLVPTLVSTGGTEKLLFNYISAIVKAHPNWQIAVLSARPKDPPYHIPNNVDFIDFESLTQRVGQYEKEVIWSRLLVQLQVKRLHIINHEGWYRWVAAHKILLGNNSYKVNVSMFMREYTHEKGRVNSLVDPFLNDIYPVVNKVFTDNKNVINEMLATNAFDPDKLIVHYQPGPQELTKPKTIKTAPQKPLRILWASRLSYQKRPDLVKQIAEKLDPRKFHIDVYGRAQHYKKEYFNDIRSLTYRGSFSGITSIPTDQYDVYLYTSDVDGVPNILLEIAAAGLPIVASNDGGVGEFVINNKTGFLVDIENIDGYVEALEHIRTHPGEARGLVTAAQALLLSQHSLKQFEQKVARDIT